MSATKGPVRDPVIAPIPDPRSRVGSSSAASSPGPTGAACDIYIGFEFRIDVSSEAGSRFDQNVTDFRAEEEFGFNATPYVATGK